MRLEFALPNEVVTVLIELADNPGARAWIEKFNGHKTKALIHDHLYVLNTTDDAIREQCLLTLENLQKIGLEYIGPVPTTPTLVTADCLNQLHRFFTHNQRDYNILQGQLSLQGHDTENKLLQIRTIISYLQELNYCVHKMEASCVREQRNLPVKEIEEIKMYTPTESNTTDWIDLTTYRQYHTDQHYDVILSSEVLGKTLLQSYIDGDDPTDWDTSGHHSSAGGLQICWTNTRQEIYQSEHFKNWLQKYNAVTVWYDFPIGNIMNHSDFQRVLGYLSSHRSNTLDVTYYQ